MIYLCFAQFDTHMLTSSSYKAELYYSLVVTVVIERIFFVKTFAKLTLKKSLKKSIIMRFITISITELR